MTQSHVVACDEKDKILPRVNFMTIFGDLYQIKLWGISKKFNPVHKSEIRLWGK